MKVNGKRKEERIKIKYKAEDFSLCLVNCT